MNSALEKILKAVENELETAKAAYQANHSDFDAGRADAYKRCLEIIQRQLNT